MISRAVGFPRIGNLGGTPHHSPYLHLKPHPLRQLMEDNGSQNEAIVVSGDIQIGERPDVYLDLVVNLPEGCLGRYIQELLNMSNNNLLSSSKSTQ
ncbi:hypothetical protein PoB_005225200 [Plakobranchus ocellatus]|uniref:Uncharacterized protein n=1 Tax=Plakobranchus ocellatus TaxID=259542 RepID=A0AAV4C300_9GAST|nr:hypothetical protein PoB_005225200 [Plakobranchus ocellatus]